MRPHLAGCPGNSLENCRGPTTQPPERAPGEDDTFVAIPGRSLGQVRRCLLPPAKPPMDKLPNGFTAERRTSLSPSASLPPSQVLLFYCRHLVAPVCSPATTPDPRNPSLQKIRTQAAVRRLSFICASLPSRSRSLMRRLRWLAINSCVSSSARIRFSQYS